MEETIEQKIDSEVWRYLDKNAPYAAEPDRWYADDGVYDHIQALVKKINEEIGEVGQYGKQCANYI